MVKKINLAILLVSILFSSCSSKFSLIKRKYNKGYHLEFVKHKAGNDASAQIVKAPAPKAARTKAENTVEKTSVVVSSNESIATPKQAVVLTARATGREKPALASKNKSEVPVVKSRRAIPEIENTLKFPAKNRQHVGMAEFRIPPAGGGMMMGGDLMYGLLYGVGTTIVVILLWLLFYALIFSAAANPELFLLLLAILVIAALVVGVLFLINAD